MPADKALNLAQFLLVSGGIRYTLGYLRRFRTPQATQTALKSTVKAVSDLRQEYSKVALSENDPQVQAGPFALFQTWFNDALANNVLEPNAMCLSTCRDNKPSARVVLLKSHNEKGFVWFTNYESRKGNDLQSNPNAALTFWWGPLERSVRIEGVVKKTSPEESDAYFNSRPRNSQLGAWSSTQSTAIGSRAELDQQESDVISQFEGVERIPRPAHWGGYRLVPSRIEFWKGRESRIHDRIVFERDSLTSTEWTMTRLQP